MKKRLKIFIYRLPIIRNILKKWKRVNNSITSLKKENKKLQTEIKKLKKENKKLAGIASMKRQMSSLHQKNSEQREQLLKTQLFAERNRNIFEKYQRDMEYLLEQAANGVKVQFPDSNHKQAIDILYHKRPLVSIIILNRNGLENLKILFASFQTAKFYDNYEMIIVDNASEDTSKEYIHTFRDTLNITLIENQENMSFSAANNLAACHAKGEYYLFLNNDTEVTDGWLDELLIAAVTKEKAGAVGAKLVYPEIPDNTINKGKSYTIQHRGIAFRDDFREKMYFTQPYNMGNGTGDIVGDENVEARAAVTAAVLLVSKEAFEKIGGYDERYIYGYEDVDLCLKLHFYGYSNYYCPKSLVYHYEFGTQNKDIPKEVRIRRLHNLNVFKGKWQAYLERKMLEDKLSGEHLFTEDNLTVALVVTESIPTTTAGDFFTAMELASSLEKLGYEVKYLNRRGEEDWYDVGLETDVVISLLDAYDITKIKNAKPTLVKIAWARNWFERWCEQPFFEAYDMVFASSETACRYVNEHSSKQAVLFPIATNGDRFFYGGKIPLDEEALEYYKSDYVFTGSYWNVKREIIDYLNPASLPYQCKIFGANWEKIDKLKPYAQGFAVYHEMPKIYQNTKIVIDDANHVTKEFGAVNSRVYDALAAGALVITNGVVGAKETFEGLLPCFETQEEFDQILKYYMEQEEERIALVAKLQKLVLAKHTYDVRAVQLREILQKHNEYKINDKRIDICGAMPDNDTKKLWGDYHYALAMKREFEAQGYEVQVKPYQQWFDRTDAKYNIVLRGTRPFYHKMEKQKNIMWNISHPEDISFDEYNSYDFVYFASDKLTNSIGSQLKVPAKTLLQCTDETVMKYQDKNEKEYELLFVGNSRGIFRESVKYAANTGYNFAIYGSKWENFGEIGRHIKAEYMDNAEIGQAYHDACILLNDHWEDMRQEGIVSNRVYDALAAEAFVLSDYMPEIEEIFEGCVLTYKNEEEFQEKVDYYMKHPKERETLAKRGREIVLQKHTFKHRVQVMMEDMEKL